MLIVIINCLFNILIFSIIYFISYSIIHFNHSVNIQFWTFIIFGFLTELIIILFAFSKLSYFFIRIFSGARSLTNREKIQLEPLIKEVIEIAAIKINNFDLKFSDLHLMIYDKKEPFTQSLGDNTLIISDGLIKNHTELEIKSLIANEVGHIFYKDNIFFTIITFGSLGFHIINWLYWHYFKLWRFMLNAFTKFNQLGAMQLIRYLSLFPILIFSPIIAFYYIGNWLFIIGINLLKHKFEYRADKFTQKLDLADGLIQFLETIASATEFDNSILGIISSNNIAPMKRIDKLEQT